MHSTTGITNILGINHPKTKPTCPPETRGKDRVEDTDAITPIIEKANAIVSRSCPQRKDIRILQFRMSPLSNL